MNAPLLRLTCTALLGLGMAACKPTPPPTDEPPQPQATAAPEATELREAIQQPIDQAKAVESNVQEAADQQASKIDAVTQ